VTILLSLLQVAAAEVLVTIREEVIMAGPPRMGGIPTIMVGATTVTEDIMDTQTARQPAVAVCCPTAGTAITAVPPKEERPSRMAESAGGETVAVMKAGTGDSAAAAAAGITVCADPVAPVATAAVRGPHGLPARRVAAVAVHTTME